MKEADLSDHHVRAISSAIYGEPRPCQVDLVRPHTEIADSSAIYLVDGAYILHVSPPAFPDAVHAEAAAIGTMRACLKDCGQVLPRLAAEGWIGEQSFMVVPRLRPLSRKRLKGRIDRLRVRGKVLDWVRALATLAEPPSGSAAAHFTSCLTTLADIPELDGEIAEATRSALAMLEHGDLAVGHVPMHGDLWLGNLLRKADGSLCVIDWGGSRQRGYGLFDLMRLGDSLHIPPRILKRELAAHQAALGGAQAAETHLLAALGHYAGNLGEFPRERFIIMAEQVWRLFASLR